MRVALCQFTVSEDPARNAEAIDNFAERAAGLGASLLVTPEASLCPLELSATTDERAYGEELDGLFVSSLAKSSERHGLTIVSGTFTPGAGTKVQNTLAVLAKGALVERYDKLHLYDAFSAHESDLVEPGSSGVKTVDVDGVCFGLATCYDLRFPELFRALVDKGAQAFLLPAAWVVGPLKEEHWFTLLRARAIENTCYVLASGECGPRSIGRSSAFDPFGLQLGDLGHGEGIGVFEVDLDTLASARAALPCLEHRRFDVSALSICGPARRAERARARDAPLLSGL